MGHRAELLVGAKRCLVEKGYARTTSRDIVAASGTNLASIGYHYGSKEALLNEALISAFQDIGEELAATLVNDVEPGAAPIERFEMIWTRIIEQFTTHRQLYRASFEVFAQSDRAPEVRAALATGMQQGRQGLAYLFRALSETGADDDPGTAQAVGSFYQALLTGLMVQWMVDPDHSPDGARITRALRIIAAWHFPPSGRDATSDPVSGLPGQPGPRRHPRDGARPLG
ncbi:TetR/AcrR family transcriptional regulator [Micromonospora sp. CPCC 205711]|uniref:TetR/AcrR family transcriptional regulator n=1 Tax=Micromonospora sp. CPCC 205547 TaxID=3122400 RepID=UPI002FEF2F6B